MTMPISLITILNYFLILTVFILFIRFMWDLFFDRNYQPVDWRDAVKRGRVSGILRKAERNYPDKVRFFNWWFQVERLKKDRIPGDFAELGVYKGESAKIIHHMDPGRFFHLFDTFSGFPDIDLAVETGEAATYTPARFSDTDIGEVTRKIAGNENIRIYPGYFPYTADQVSTRRFALVNMDADLYNPTKAGLAFFYPRLSPGGVIIVHDYNVLWEGVRRAVDEFAATIPESVTLLPDQNGTVMIIRSKKS
jgi:O-methyltransferase